MNVKDIYRLFQKTKGVVTDTRLSVKNSFYIALKGINFDGNNFAKEAIEKGAFYALVNKKSIAKDNDRFIYVDDTLKTLQKLANYHRSIIDTKIIAITGSNGKTTTKELLSEILSKEFKIFATKGNLNNHIGVPLSLLSINRECEYAIIELGANHLGEINHLCKIAKPDFGLITNFGYAHIEGFGSFDGVVKGKSELYNYLIEKKGRLFINLDDVIQKKWLKYRPISTYGQTSKADFKIEQINNKGKGTTIKIENLIIESQLFGDYNFSNIGASVAISRFLGVSNQKIKKALELYKPINKRSQVINKKNNKILLDAYNANPSSMIASINSFLKNNPKNSIAVLGDMLELGFYEKEGHVKIIKLLESSAFEEIFFVGKLFFKFSKESNSFKKTIHFFKEKIEAYSYLKKRKFKNKNILIKGSRKLQLEDTISFF
tara:strand:- start:10894 stop:12192 length:1299 start_codon:yes stop_codon:yes gene_type:complete